MPNNNNTVSPSATTITVDMPHPSKTLHTNATSSTTITTPIHPPRAFFFATLFILPMVLTCTLYLSNSVYRLTTPRSSTAPTAPIIPTVFMGLTQICFGGTTIDDCQSIESFCAASVPPDAEQRIVDLICGGERVAMRGLVGAAMAVGGFALFAYAVQILSWTRVLPIFRSTTSLEKLQRINTLFRTTVIFLATLHGLFLIVTGSLMLSLRGSFMDAMKGINGGVELYWGMYVCVGAVVVDAVFVPWYAYMQRRVFFVVRDGEGRFDPLDM